MSFVKDKIRKQGKKRGPVTRARAKDDIITQAEKIIEILAPYRKAALQVWIDGLKAMKEQYDPLTKTTRDVPDLKERRENARLLIAYTDGMPTTSETTDVFVHEEISVLLSMAKQSPAAVRALEAMSGVTLESIQKTGGEKVVEVPSEGSA